MMRTHLCLSRGPGDGGGAHACGKADRCFRFCLVLLPSFPVYPAFIKSHLRAAVVVGWICFIEKEHVDSETSDKYLESRQTEGRGDAANTGSFSLCDRDQQGLEGQSSWEWAVHL